jgi:diguanylate cyclase (GGDEF)-like protein
MNLLNNYRISSRILASFSCLIIIAVVAAVFGYFQLTTIKRQIIRFVAASDNTSGNHDVQFLIARMRLLGLKLQTNADEATISQFHADATTAAALLAAAAQGSNSNDLRTRYSDASQVIATLQRDFNTLVKLAHATEEARAKLYTGGDELTERTEQLMATARAYSDEAIRAQSAEIEKLMLLVRVANWRFLTTHDPQGIKIFDNNAKVARDTLNVFQKTVMGTDLAPLVQQIVTSFDQYATNFDAISAAVTQSRQLYDNSMRSLFDEVAEDGATTQTIIDADLADARQHTDNTVSTTITSQLIFTGLTVLFGVGLAYPIGRSIVVPIAQMTEAMRQLAAGDKSVEIPVRNAQDEISHMAHAVEVFRETMIEADVASAERHRLDREVHVLSSFNQWLQSCNSLDELYDMIGAFLTRLLPSCAGNLFIYANSRDVLENTKVWNGGKMLPAMHPEDCWGLRRGRTYTFGDEDIEFPCAHVREAAPTPYCCIPILAHGETVGLLHFNFGEAAALAAPSHADERRLGIVCAEQISLAIANVKLRDQLRDQSIRDPLTGLFNRRYLMETCRREFARATRAGQSVGVMSIDIDHFKQYNDNHGHDAGDTVLRLVGARLNTLFRAEDVPCRLGGEEFVVMLPGANLAVSARRAEQLRVAVEGLTVRYLDRELPHITISVGVAAFPAAGDTPSAVLRVADQALYRAKAAGRNRVEVAVPGDTHQSDDPTALAALPPPEADDPVANAADG